MDPLDAIYIPPPAYSEQEFDQKTLRATELSLQMAKWEMPKVDLDEEGFPSYDPAMFEDTQKGKDQPTTATIRSSSISKRPLPNPSQSSSSTNAGPSTFRQTAPLHISKRSISKAEEATRDAARNVLASSSSLMSVPNQRVADTLEDYPPYVKDMLEDNPPYTATNIPASTPYLQPRLGQSSQITLENSPPYVEGNAPVSTSSRQSIVDQRTEDIQGDNLARRAPAPGPQSIANHCVRDSPEDNPSHVARNLPASNSSLQPSPDRSISVADPPEDNPPYTTRNLSVSTPNLQPGPNQSVEGIQTGNPPYEPNYRAQPLYDEGAVVNWEQDGATSRQYQSSTNVSLDRPRSVELELPQHSMQGRGLLTPNMAPMINRTPNVQSQYSVAPNTPARHGPQHFSLPPVPRTLPRTNTSERPRSQAAIFNTPSSASSQPHAPRVGFNPNVAYGENLMGGPLPHFPPKAQTQVQTHFDPHMFYNSVVSSQMNAPMTMPDQSPQLSYPAQRPQVWPSQTYSSPTNSSINQSRQWRWHSPDRPSNTYGSVPDASYGGGTDVSRYSHYSMTNNGYFNR